MDTLGDFYMSPNHNLASFLNFSTPKEELAAEKSVEEIPNYIPNKEFERNSDIPVNEKEVDKLNNQSPVFEDKTCELNSNKILITPKSMKYVNPKLPLTPKISKEYMPCRKYSTESEKSIKDLVLTPNHVPVTPEIYYSPRHNKKVSEINENESVCCDLKNSLEIKNEKDTAFNSSKSSCSTSTRKCSMSNSYSKNSSCGTSSSNSRSSSSSSSSSSSRNSSSSTSDSLIKTVKTSPPPSTSPKYKNKNLKDKLTTKDLVRKNLFNVKKKLNENGSFEETANTNLSNQKKNSSPKNFIAENKSSNSNNGVFFVSHKSPLFKTRRKSFKKILLETTFKVEDEGIQVRVTPEIELLNLQAKKKTKLQLKEKLYQHLRVLRFHLKYL